MRLKKSPGSQRPICGRWFENNNVYPRRLQQNLHSPINKFWIMKMFCRQFPIKRTNFRSHTTIIEGPNLFGPKSSFHVLKKTLPLKNGKTTDFHFLKTLKSWKKQRIFYKLWIAERKGISFFLQTLKYGKTRIFLLTLNSWKHNIFILRKL